MKKHPNVKIKAKGDKLTIKHGKKSLDLPLSSSSSLLSPRGREMIRAGGLILDGYDVKVKKKG